MSFTNSPMIFFRFFFLVFTLGMAFNAPAQGRTANWIFGDGFHVKFEEAGTTVLPYIDDFFAFEGSSCISSSNGELLFYSNNLRLWNRNFEPLFNSDTLPGLTDPPWSTKASGSLFLPWPGDTSERFYAYFNMNDFDHKLYMSKLDQDLASGLGGILEEFKNQLVWNSDLSEQLNAVRHANGRDWWIVARKGSLLSDEFILALLTPNGIDSVGVQSCGFLGAYQGEIAFSSNGDLLALATGASFSCATIPSTIALYSFDRCYGQINLIDSMRTRSCGQNAYGVGFSKNGSKLYYTTSLRTKLYQVSWMDHTLVDTLIFDVRGPNALAVGGGGIEIGADGRMYVN